MNTRLSRTFWTEARFCRQHASPDFFHADKITGSGWADRQNITPEAKTVFQFDPEKKFHQLNNLNDAYAKHYRDEAQTLLALLPEGETDADVRPERAALRRNITQLAGKLAEGISVIDGMQVKGFRAYQNALLAVEAQLTALEEATNSYLEQVQGVSLHDKQYETYADRFNTLQQRDTLSAKRIVALSNVDAQGRTYYYMDVPRAWRFRFDRGVDRLQVENIAQEMKRIRIYAPSYGAQEMTILFNGQPVFNRQGTRVTEMRTRMELHRQPSGTSEMHFTWDDTMTLQPPERPRITTPIAPPPESGNGGGGKKTVEPMPRSPQSAAPPAEPFPKQELEPGPDRRMPAAPPSAPFTKDNLSPNTGPSAPLPPPLEKQELQPQRPSPATPPATPPRTNDQEGGAPSDSVPPQSRPPYRGPIDRATLPPDLQ